jgi:hypothetical protein
MIERTCFSDTGCGETPCVCRPEREQEWPDHGLEDTHDFTPADWDCGLGEVDCGGE